MLYNIQNPSLLYSRWCHGYRPEELPTISSSFARSRVLVLHGRFTPAAKDCKHHWMTGANSAVDVRWAFVRESFAKAQFQNTKQLQEKLSRAGNLVDKHRIRTALGKRQPKQRMWALSESAPLGINMVVGEKEQANCSNSSIRSQSPGRYCEFQVANTTYCSGSAGRGSSVTFSITGLALVINGVA